MKLAVDMHVLEGPPQGSRRYLEELYRAFIAQGFTNDCELEFWVEHRRPALEVRFPCVNWREYANSSRLARLGWVANRLIRASEPDWIHFQYVLPRKKASLEAVTIHDVLFETHPEYFSTAQRMALKLLVRRAAQRADLILTVSEYSRAIICDLYGCDPKKVLLTPNGINPHHYHSLGREESLAWVTQRYGIPRFFLSVGRIDQRKNLVALVEAYALARKRHEDFPGLLIVGYPGNAYSQVMGVISRLGVGEWVRHLKGITDEELPLLYRAAEGFLFPSWAEGFGIPVIEAMASGCPVACSEGTALGELIENGRGIRIDPESKESMVEAMEVFAEERPDYPGAREWAKAFSWERSSAVLAGGLGL